MASTLPEKSRDRRCSRKRPGGHGRPTGSERREPRRELQHRTARLRPLPIRIAPPNGSRPRNGTAPRLRFRSESRPCTGFSGSAKAHRLFQVTGKISGTKCAPARFPSRQPPTETGHAIAGRKARAAASGKDRNSDPTPPACLGPRAADRETVPLPVPSQVSPASLRFRKARKPGSPDRRVGRSSCPSETTRPVSTGLTPSRRSTAYRRVGENGCRVEAGTGENPVMPKGPRYPFPRSARRVHGSALSGRTQHSYACPRSRIAFPIRPARGPSRSRPTRTDSRAPSPVSHPGWARQRSRSWRCGCCGLPPWPSN